MTDIKEFLFEGDLQSNLKECYKKYGGNFAIKYKSHIIPCFLRKETFWELGYYKETRTTELLPFLIVFGDFVKSKANENCWINFVHKTDELSGTEIMLFIIVYRTK